MPHHPAWDIYESALLHDICLRVERGELFREAAIQELSKTFRQNAGRNDDNDTYRNEAGISWQYNYMYYLITRPGYERGSKVFQELRVSTGRSRKNTRKSYGKPNVFFQSNKTARCRGRMENGAERLSKPSQAVCLSAPHIGCHSIFASQEGKGLFKSRDRPSRIASDTVRVFGRET